MASETPRHAIYYTPDRQSALWRFGTAVIGTDAYAATDVPLAVPPGLDIATWLRLTEEPRRYGFHATLKAPFHLAAGATEDALLEAVSQLAAGLAAVPIGPLVVRVRSSFAALYNEGEAIAVSRLADEVVRNLEPFRAPLTDADRARRLAAGLGPEAQRYLDLYGYPYVRELYRFHMTLTGPLPAEQRPAIEQLLSQAWQAAAGTEPTAIDALSVLRQDRRDGRFRVIARFPLAAAPRSPAAPR